MSESRSKIVEICIRLGGEKHLGWLPPGAATPLPTPTRDVIIDLTIDQNGAGPDCILICEAQDGSLCWDTWHESMNDAKLAALESYGVEPTRWTGANSNGPAAS